MYLLQIVSIDLTLQASQQPYVVVPSTFYPGEEGDFDVFMYLWHESPVIFKPILAIEEEPEPEEVAQEENQEVETEATEAEVSPVEVQIPTEEPTAEPVEEEVTKDQEPAETEKPTEEPEPVDEPTSKQDDAPASTEGIPPPPTSSGGPPPPPTIGKKKTTTSTVKKPIKRAATEPVDVFKQIQQGTFLRKVAPAEKTCYAKRAQTEMFKGFNMAKIVARRTALEFSDDEEEDDWSDHDDEDDWW